jgi:hypothetical protein
MAVGLKMHPLLLVPASFLSFLVGAAFMRRKEGDHKAPLSGVPFLSWERFVAVMVMAPKDHVSKKGKLGTFQMDARRLKDIGAMKTAVKGFKNGEPGVWMGEWSEPLTETAFLGSMPLQYAAFVRSMRAAAPKVSGYVGVEVDGLPCSLSGLLGVSHAAGEAGVKSWVSDPKTRTRFAGTTELFRRANKIF